MRSNNDLPGLLNLTGATTSTPVSSAPQTNPYGKGVKLFIDVPALSAGSIVVTLQSVFAGVVSTLLASASITTTGRTILTVYPGLPATANASANDVLPRQWQVTVTPTGFTGTVNIGASVIV